MKTTVIDIEPSREGYINMLKLIAESSTVKEDRIWAKEELAKIQK